MLLEHERNDGLGMDAWARWTAELAAFTGGTANML